MLLTAMLLWAVVPSVKAQELNAKININHTLIITQI